jgi:histidinol-phosphate/aromatic aminotransferase/cobyric acid decarboxylase-like protein
VPGPILPSRTAAEHTVCFYEGFLLGALATPASRPATSSHLPFLYSSFGLVKTRSTDSGKPSPLGALRGGLLLICPSATTQHMSRMGIPYQLSGFTLEFVPHTATDRRKEAKSWRENKTKYPDNVNTRII